MSLRRDKPDLPATVHFAAAVDDIEPDFPTVRRSKQIIFQQFLSQSGGSGEPSPEELLAQWPVNPRTDEDAASLVYRHFCRAREQQADISLREYIDRFPEHRDSLERLSRREEMLRSLGDRHHDSPHLCLPGVGARLFGFELVYELGRGSFARVFLARQEPLASRFVVLKVSNIEGDEPQTMALLQHTNIVPIYSVHEDRAAGLRAVCMPYFGGASLSMVLKQAGVENAPIRSGADLITALQAVQAPIPTNEHGSSVNTLAGDPRVLTLLRSYSYPQAASWIVARLAEGLQHSHARGVLHRDIKPSNVLLGLDGQPMLLDFNLAQVTRSREAEIVIGGTINYMAPEHLRSLLTRDIASTLEVDHRADIYSLGMVLYEMLAGRSPFAESASYTPLPLLVEAMAVERGREAPSLREVLPSASWNLESIVLKCLAPRPQERYQQAEHFAEDLQRFLEDRPLRYAPEMSLRERGRKWRRRHPRLATAGAVGGLAALLLLALSGILIGTQELLAATRSQLGETQHHLRRAQAEELKRAFRAGTIRALCLVNTTTDGHDQLSAGVLECENTLELYQILSRDDWQTLPAWQELGDSDRERLGEDARELLLLLAWARVSAAPQDPAAAREALDLLDRCETVAGQQPLRAVWEDRAIYLDRLGEAGAAEAARLVARGITPACARDHYLLALSFARTGRHADAIAELDSALQHNPDHYWSLVQRGICFRERGELLLAAGDFSRCAGLAPDFAWGHYNLGCILDQNLKREQAIACYTAAIRSDAGFALAYLNRGLAQLDQKRFQSALEDLNHAARLGRDDALLHLGRGSAHQGLQENDQADAAFAAALRKLADLPPSRQLPLLLRYGFSIHKRLPAEAEAAFERARKLQPHHPQALYGLAMVLVDRGLESEALARFEEALKWHPTFVDARRFRAVLLARQGRLSDAQEEINRCLLQDPHSGITAYAAACVLAQAAASNREVTTRRLLEDQALEFLARAFQNGYGLAEAGKDPDLRSLHHRPEMQNLLPPGPMGGQILTVPDRHDDLRLTVEAHSRQGRGSHHNAHDK